MDFLSGFDRSMAEFESLGFATINNLEAAKGNLCLMGRPLSCFSASFFDDRGRGRQQPQFCPKPIDLGQFKRTHTNPLPSLRHSDQGRKDQLQATLLVKETRNDFGPSLLFLKGPLQQVRRPNRLSMPHRTSQMIQRGLQILRVFLQEFYGITGNLKKIREYHKSLIA